MSADELIKDGCFMFVLRKKSEYKPQGLNRKIIPRQRGQIKRACSELGLWVFGQVNCLSWEGKIYFHFSGSA